MKRALVTLIAVMSLTLSTVHCFAGDEPTTRPIGDAALLNSDCIAPLVNKYPGRCHVECFQDRDCGWGNYCDLSSGARNAICKPKPQKGGFTGRVERRLGEGVNCSIEIWPVSRGETSDPTACNATSGGFMKEGLEPGIYLLRVTARSADGMSATRDFYAPVNSGQVTDLGALIVLVGDPITIPTRPGLPGTDMLRQPAPDPSRAPRINPNIGQPPIR